mgnify:CR=1 FL=1|tara:strand:- start:20121 stop:20405 length:285 start_codon:yes stop_codon:yes gene_type:complete
MSNQLRKIRRNGAKKLVKDFRKTMANEIKQKFNMFDRIPEGCMICNTPFDRNSKEMAFSWKVFVKQDEIRLYCPECFEKGEKMVEKLKEMKDGV